MQKNLILHPQDASDRSLAPRRDRRRTGKTMLKRMVALDDTTMRKLKVLGGGNVSRGIRVAAHYAFDKYQQNLFPDYYHYDI